MMEPSDPQAPIGVFDSGLGGLTVLSAMQRAMPDESFVYLGDTARVPYGTKSSDSVTRYALQVVARLQRESIKLLVVACNTASAQALPAIREAFPALPVVGVVEPGARAAAALSGSGHIGVIATEGTIARGAYTRAIAEARPDATVSGVACSLFVALVEEGWYQGELVTAIVREYLGPFLEASEPIDTLVLGCTHFPVLKPVLREVLGESVSLVDSAETTAVAVRDMLARRSLQRTAGHRKPPLRLWVTDGPERFARVAGVFMGRPVSPEKVELVDL